MFNLFGKNISVESVSLRADFHRITCHWGLRPNSLFISSSEYCILIDPGQKPMSDRLKSAIRKISSKPVQIVINTHLHGDHIGANRDFKEATVIDASFLSKSNFRTLPIAITRMKDKLSLEYSVQYYILETFIGQMFLIPVPGIHSGDDMLVYCPEQGIVHMGDLLLTQSFPAVGVKLKEYLHFLESCISFFPKETQFVGGHGAELSFGGLVEYKNMVVQSSQLIKKYHQSGWTREKMLEQNILEPWAKYGEYISFINQPYWIDGVLKNAMFIK